MRSTPPRGWRRLAGRVAVVATAAALASCGPEAGAPGAAPATAGSHAWFVDRAADVGLDFRHFNGMTGAWYDAEIFGGGIALVDVDNDGDLDAYFVQGAQLGNGDAAPLIPPPPGPLTDRLYRNDLAPGPAGPVLGFTDVTAGSGIDARGYGMGIAAGDIDNDGWIDLYVTNLGPNQLLRNDGVRFPPAADGIEVFENQSQRINQPMA
jgi:hypothetical protein